MTDTQTKQLIEDGESLESARFASSGTDIPVYDDGFGPLWIHRDSMGVSGIVRAQTFGDAYEICENEFFSEADETVEELVKEYGFKREHRKVIRTSELIPADKRHPQLGAQERFAKYPSDYSDNGRLPEHLFLRWETIETPDPDAWTENELFCEAFGFRPNGPNERDVLNHGIYAKDLNGDWLEPLTPELRNQLGIELVVESEDLA